MHGRDYSRGARFRPPRTLAIWCCTTEVANVLPGSCSYLSALVYRGSIMFAGGSAVWDSPDGIRWSPIGELPEARYGGGLVSFTPPGN